MTDLTIVQKKMLTTFFRILTLMTQIVHSRLVAKNIYFKADMLLISIT